MSCQEITIASNTHFISNDASNQLLVLNSKPTWAYKSEKADKYQASRHNGFQAFPWSIWYATGVCAGCLEPGVLLHTQFSLEKGRNHIWNFSNAKLWAK